MRARADLTAEKQGAELCRELKDGAELPRHEESKIEFSVSFLSAFGAQEGEC